MSGKRNGFLLNAGLLILSVVFSLIFAEVLLRFIYPKPQKDQVISVEFRHSWVFNSQGFRDEDFGLKLDRRKENLILLGDSFTVGLGVEPKESFASLLSEKIKQDYEVFNLGKCAIGSYKEYLILKEYIDVIRPKAVFLVFFWNDLQDNFSQETDEALQGLRVTESHRQRPFFAFLNPVKPFLIKSLLFHYVSLNYRVLLAKAGFSKLDLGLELDLFEKDSASPAVKISWDNTERYLLDMRELCWSRSVDFYVLYLPKREQLYRWDNVMRFYQVDVSRYDRFLANHRLKDFCESRQIKFIDVTDELDRSDGKGSFYYKFDSHLTAKGHRAYFEKIYGRLKPILKSSKT